MHIIMPNQSPQRTLPSDVPIQEQQPKRPPLGSTCTHTQHPEGPLMSVTLEKSQTSVENHPVQSFRPGSGVYTQTPQLQGPLATFAYENSQLMQRNAYPQRPPTQRTVPRDMSQAAGIPVASIPCTQPQQSKVYPQGSRQEASQGAVLIRNHEVQRFQPDAISQQSRDAHIYVPATVSTWFQQHQMPFQCNTHPTQRSNQPEVHILRDIR